MKKNSLKVISVLLIVSSIISIGINAYAHSGRTDSNGGHKDNKNKSGLGSYHYHCGGHPAHLHNNGVCPYSSNSSSSAKKTSTAPTTIVATSIKINENIKQMKVKERKKLTVTLIPDNVTNKSITWKSSDNDIATISSEGEIIAKKSGIVEITATSSNGKTSTIKINIKQDEKIQDNTINETSMTGKNNSTNHSDLLKGTLAIGALGGIGYCCYKKYKNS